MVAQKQHHEAAQGRGGAPIGVLKFVLLDFSNPSFFFKLVAADGFKPALLMHVSTCMTFPISWSCTTTQVPESISPLNQDHLR